MLLLTSLRLRLLLAGGLGTAAADPGTPLRVLRSAPSQDAAPTAAITVTFDRPVAGSLDRTVDPRQILTIEPVVAGRAEWRDPVTLRFRPSAPLAPNATYRVTVSDRFEAMDGSRLAAPYSFGFRVRGPRVLAGVPVGPDRQARFLTTAPAFELVLDAPADAAGLNRSVYLELDKQCVSPGVVRLRAQSQRAVTDQDRWEFRDAGGWDRDRSADSLRRVVRLVPERELPRGCAGHMVAPASLDERGRDSLQRWPFSTYGPLRLIRADCGWSRDHCPTGPLTVTFSTPVKGAELQRHLRFTPATSFTVSDTAEERDQWVLEAELAPRNWYGVVADSGLRDVFGQRLTGNPVATARTSGYSPAINYAWGRAVVERKGPRTLAVTHVNVDTLEVLVAPVPDSLERELMSRSEWQWAELWPALLPRAKRRRIAVAGTTDRVGIYGVPLPEPAAAGRGPTLLAVQVTSPRLDSVSRRTRPIALVQVTDLGAHARVGATDGAVWVTGASDGLPRAGATVTLHDPTGAVLAAAKSGADGVARFSTIRRPPPKADEGEDYGRPEGYVAVALGGDRTLVPLNRYDPDLSPWRFNVSAAWGSSRLPIAGAVFTERGIYRPGERVYAKSIVRTGLLGSLSAPARGDSLRWVFYDRSGDDPERGRLQEKTVALSAFGTAQSSLVVPATAGLGTYEVAVELRRDGKWTEIASTWYRVAEYRPPEFLVDVAADSGARFAGDSIGATVDARYLFGAPMGRAVVSWTMRQQSDGGGPSIPGVDDYLIGDTGWWWEEMEGGPAPVQVTASGTDTLDARGRLALRLPLGGTQKGRTGFATFEATVKDVNRQTVSGSAGAVVHPAAFYLGAKPDGEEYFWTTGTPVSVGVIAVRPDGRREPGVRVAGTVVRKEWHQLHRERDGYGEVTGEWVSDTVARCAVVTAAEPVRCGFTPKAGGTYTVTFRATDTAGREAVTSFVRWTTGKDWVPWNDASQFKMDVIPDRSRYSVGDTATVLFASPFTGAEAWITVEREGLIQQRRLRIASGTTTLKLPITEALAPNAFVSIIVARGRSAAPGRVDDPGRPTIRVGYTDLRVTPERKRLTVAVEPTRAEWRPGDTAQVSVSVRASERGVKSEVTLWAVDAGVLALTGYTTPDPLDLIYRPRGLGLRLASNLTSVAAQIPEGQKGKRTPGGGGGADAADVLRSRFQTTAFFLGSVVTDTAGRAVARAKLPDNLTTFRLMAVAVTAGDRYGKGESSLLVTRPLVARPALPRFLRDGDRFAAGVVVNRRSGAADRATVTASATGVRLAGAETQTVELEPGRGREVRFDFRGLPGDSASFRFDARSGADGDAVRVALPVRPPYRPRAYTVAGVLQDTSGIEILLPPGIDPARSELVVSLGTSPLTVIRGAERWLRIYPYWCTEQLSSGAQPLIALLKASKRLSQDSLAGPRVRADLERVVATLLRRQREDGGIGIWSATDWTTPWLSSYAGQVLLDARDLGIPVGDSALAKLGRYLKTSLTEPAVAVVPVARWWSDTTAAMLSERLQALDYLSRAGRRDRAGENELLRMAPQLFWEDRVRLAWLFARAGDRTVARRLLEPAWASVTIEGRRATLPVASRRDFYFPSHARPSAWLLSATLAVEPTHRLVGPLVETLIDHSRGAGWRWNTQDWGTTVSALSEFWARQRQAAARGVRVRSGGTQLFTFTAASDQSRDSAVTLARLPAGDRVRLSFEAMAPGEPVYWYATLREVPKAAPVRPDDAGMQVERWYERLEDGKPVTSVAEGELVRVRLRITVPAERNFVILDDALPAGLEAVDLSLRTVGGVPGPGAADSAAQEPSGEGGGGGWPFRWAYGGWDAGWWTPFDHREIRDDRVVFVATTLWKGSYTATYVARATTPGTFVRPPAHAEEMYNPAVFGRSDGGVFEIRRAEERKSR